MCTKRNVLISLSRRERLKLISKDEQALQDSERRTSQAVMQFPLEHSFHLYVTCIFIRVVNDDSSLNNINDLTRVRHLK